MAQPVTITLDELREGLAKQPYYANRGAVKTLQIADWLIDIRSLPAAVADWSKRRPNRDWELVRFGVVGWRGLTDNLGEAVPFASEPVEIYGRNYPAVSRDLMDLIPDAIIIYLKLEIAELTTLTTEELAAVDFTPPPAVEDASQAAQAKGLTLTESVTPADGAQSS